MRARGLRAVAAVVALLAVSNLAVGAASAVGGGGAVPGAHECARSKDLERWEVPPS